MKSESCWWLPSDQPWWLIVSNKDEQLQKIGHYSSVPCNSLLRVLKNNNIWSQEDQRSPLFLCIYPCPLSDVQFKSPMSSTPKHSCLSPRPAYKRGVFECKLRSCVDLINEAFLMFFHFRLGGVCNEEKNIGVKVLITNRIIWNSKKKKQAIKTWAINAKTTQKPRLGKGGGVNSKTIELFTEVHNKVIISNQIIWNSKTHNQSLTFSAPAFAPLNSSRVFSKRNEKQKKFSGWSRPKVHHITSIFPLPLYPLFPQSQAPIFWPFL